VSEVKKTDEVEAEEEMDKEDEVIDIPTPEEVQERLTNACCGTKGKRNPPPLLYFY